MSRSITAAVLLSMIGLLAGCGDDDRRGSTPFPPQTNADFSTYAETLVRNNTCDNSTPVAVNAVQFSFAADEATVDAADVSNINAGCGGS